MSIENKFIKNFNLGRYNISLIGNADCVNKNWQNCLKCYEKCNYRGHIIIVKDGKQLLDDDVEINRLPGFLQQKEYAFGFLVDILKEKKYLEI